MQLSKPKLKSPVRWYGGKGRILDKLLPLVPSGGRPYCEPYCGGASLFFSRPPAPVEVLNDLDGGLVNLFRCLQSPNEFAELSRKIRYTLYARSEFAKALEILNDKDSRFSIVDQAWAFFVAKNQGFSGVAKTEGNWGRTFISNGTIAGTTNQWCMRLTMLDDWHVRLLPVQIDCIDALECIRYWDNEEAVFYVDPPYHPESLSKYRAYSVDASHEQHLELVETLLNCEGSVTLSGYEHASYDPLVRNGWRVFQFPTACNAAGRVRGSKLRGAGNAKKFVPRVECVWINPKAQALLAAAKERPQFPLDLDESLDLCCPGTAPGSIPPGTDTLE